MYRLAVAIILVAVSMSTTTLAQKPTLVPQKYRDTDVPTLLTAAKAGHPEAMAWMGIKSHDKVEATRWYLKAADAGQAFGMFMAGVAFWSGRGIQQDMVEGYKWLDLSTKFTSEKNQPALTALQGLTRVLSTTQITEAKRRAADWEADFQKRKKSQGR